MVPPLPSSRSALSLGPSKRPQADKRAGAAKRSNTLLLALGATGVVFGDIGTSPLYTFQAIISELADTDPNVPTVTTEAIVGAFGMMFWVLILIACVKYLGIVMRVSHHGEGGTLAMMQAILGRIWLFWSEEFQLGRTMKVIQQYCST